MPKIDFSNYQSPFTWRYGSVAMRQIFSEQRKYQIWRQIWVALARAEHQAGLLSDAELADLEQHQDDLDIDQILANEVKTRHDVVAAINEFADKAKVGGGKVHLGATSMDVVDNADALRLKQALKLIRPKLASVMRELAIKIEATAQLPSIGLTHLQTAEPTTVGYRLSFYAQDLLADYKLIEYNLDQIRGKGMKGAVGTAASYQAVLQGSTVTPKQLEDSVMQELGITASPISTQVSSRKQDYLVLSALASLGSSLAKFAGDLRILQSPFIGEWSEPFGKDQVGSSAMPFKKNPIAAEKICSLARYVATLPAVALENATLSYLERTLDDSANRRVIVPEAFLAVDEILSTSQKLISGLVFNKERIKFNLEQYAPFAATEAILIEAVKSGADRQQMHDVLRRVSLQAWEQVQSGRPNPMVQLLSAAPELASIKPERLQQLLDVTSHVGDAPQRALELAKQIKTLTA